MKLILCTMGLGGFLLALNLSATAAPLTAGEPMLLEKTSGKFDFLRVDSVRHRLLLAHTGNKSLDVVDLGTRKLIKSIATGAAQDSSVDYTNGLYFVSVSAPPHMAIIDATTLEVTGEVPLPAPADLLMFAPASGMVIVCNDDDPEEWIIDPQAKKIVSTVKLPGKGMEDLAFGPHHKRLFQVMKDANAMAVIDTSDYKVTDTWPTAPAASPHGMAMLPEAEFILVAGGNGKLVMMDRMNGKVVASAEIASKVDEIGYDSELHRVYCASGTGKISVVGVEGDKLTALGDVAGAAGCHSIVVDPQTHMVWIAYAKGNESYAQPFTPDIGK